MKADTDSGVLKHLRAIHADMAGFEDHWICLIRPKPQRPGRRRYLKAVSKILAPGPHQPRLIIFSAHPPIRPYLPQSRFPPG